MVGLHNSITMSFMLVGHTKFSPDWCFGLLKQKYRKSYVSCLQDIVDVVNQSADVNTAQLVGSQDGEVLVPMYVRLGNFSRRTFSEGSPVETLPPLHLPLPHSRGGRAKGV